MDVLIVLVFVSLVLVSGAVLLLLVSLHQRDFEHSERLSLLPISGETSGARVAHRDPPASTRDTHANDSSDPQR